MDQDESKKTGMLLLYRLVFCLGTYGNPLKTGDP